MAAGVVAEGDAAVTIGSSGVVFAAASAYGAAPDGRVQVGAHALPQRWYLMGVTQAAGLSLRWLRDTFMPGISYDQLVLEATDSPPGSRGLLWLPYLQGERTPHLDVDARGALVGLTTAHGRADIVRAVLEGVAFSLRDAAGAIQSVGVSVDRFKLAGGGARSPLWRQIVADVFECSDAGGTGGPWPGLWRGHAGNCCSGTVCISCGSGRRHGRPAPDGRAEQRRSRRRWRQRISATVTSTRRLPTRIAPLPRFRRRKLRTRNQAIVAPLLYSTRSPRPTGRA